MVNPPTKKCLRCGRAYGDKATIDDPYDVFCSRECRLDDWLHLYPLPNIFLHTDLERLHRPEQIAHVREWIKEREDLEGFPGLLLHGQASGTGKTRVATWAFLEQIVFWWSGRKVEKEDLATGAGGAGLWYSVTTFRQKYLECLRDHENKAKWLQRLCKVNSLCLDDIDKLRSSEGLLELLYSVLDTRLADKEKATIVTTNLCGHALAERWGPEYGPYLVRRLREFSLTLNFD